MIVSKNEQIGALALEVLEDVEMSRTSLEKKYAELTKRRIDQETYVAPLVGIETAVMAIENKIQAAMSFKPTGSHGIPQFGNQQKTNQH